MCKEAHFSLAVLTVFACFGSVPRGVQPAFKDAMRELAAFSTAARATAVLRAHRAGVMKPPRVAAAGFFARVGKGTVGPIVAPAAGAPADLELVHPEVIGGVGVIVGAGVGINRVVVRKEFLEKGVVGKHVAAVKGGGYGGAAGEELPWWDVNVSEGLLGREELVGSVELVVVLIRTDTTHFGQVCWVFFCVCVFFVLWGKNNEEWGRIVCESDNGVCVCVDIEGNKGLSYIGWLKRESV